MERRQITFRGRVQGVGFRATARAVAGSFTDTAWVPNEPDGSVLLEVLGQTDEIDGFLDSLRDRMEPLITGVDSRRAALVPDDRGFEVRR